jgi:hypothetical protein
MAGRFADGCRHRPEGALACAWLAALPPAAVWIAFTAIDGRNYHVAPFIVAAAPGVAARVLGLRIGLVGRSVAVAGIVAGALAWSFIEVLGIVPSATLWRDRPGGVRAEVVVAAAAGAFVGVLASRPPRRADPAKRPEGRVR